MHRLKGSQTRNLPLSRHQHIGQTPIPCHMHPTHHLQHLPHDSQELTIPPADTLLSHHLPQILQGHHLPLLFQPPTQQQQACPFFPQHYNRPLHLHQSLNFHPAHHPIMVHGLLECVIVRMLEFEHTDELVVATHIHVVTYLVGEFDAIWR